MKVPRIALPVRECPYESSFPVSNARRDPRHECDDATTICALSGKTCCLEDGMPCHEFPDLKPRLYKIKEGTLV